MIFDQRSVSHPLGELKGWGQNSFFSEHGHATYKVKENLQVLLYSKCSKSPPRGWGQLVKIQLSQNMLMLHIKLKESTQCSNKVANIFLQTPYPLTLWSG